MTMATTNIDTHLPCHACQYDLHALASDGFCPECGLLIAHSIQLAPAPFEVRGSHITFGYALVGSCLLIVTNFLVILSNLPVVGSFACVWAIVGLASMVGSIAFAFRKQHEMAVAMGIVMMFSMPAVMLNLFVFVATGRMYC